MEVYTKKLESLLTEKYSIAILTEHSLVVERDYTVLIFPHILNSCPSEFELNNSLSKRLDTKLHTIAICCICSYGYTVNHHSILNISFKDMQSVWSHLETAKTSSSPDLQKWLTESMNNRTQDGYNMHFRNEQQMVKPNIQHTVRSTRGVKVDKIGTVFSNTYFGSGKTILEAMKSDTKTLLALRLVNGFPPDTITRDTTSDLTE